MKRIFIFFLHPSYSGLQSVRTKSGLDGWILRNSVVILSFVSIIIFFTFPSLSFAQSVSPASSSSVRNKLILLDSPLNGEVHFNRFNTRTKAVLVRINKLHSRILTRIAKLKIDANSLKKINLQINAIKTDLSDLEKTLETLDQDWQNIKTTKNKADYLSLKKNLDQTLLKIEEILKNQKLILKELKKYKLTMSPTQSLVEPDRN